MKKIDLKILDNRIGKEFPMPSYATQGSSGIDLRACNKHNLSLLPGEKYLVSTGLSIHIIDKNVTGIILPRSGLSHNNGITLSNALGLIDSDYQGPLMTSLLNISKKIFILKPGMRVAQIIFIPIFKVHFNLVKHFNYNSKRGNQGFGHSGLN